MIAVAPPPIVAVGEALALPPTSPPPRLREHCAARPSPTTALHAGKIFDFAALDIAPVDYGPRVEEQPRAGLVRTPQSIQAALGRQRDRLEACLRGALGHGLHVAQITDGGGVSAAVAYTLTIDPHGLAVDIEATGDGPLATCVRESLAAVHVDRETPRETRVGGWIAYRHFEREKPAPRPPAPPPATAIARCIPTIDPVPVDKLDDVDLEVDFAPRRGGGWLGTPCSSRSLDKTQIRAAITANLGALRACHAAASRRSPGLAGIARARFVLLLGRAEQITVEGAGDAELHACLHDALAAIAAPSLRAPIEVNVPLALTAELPALPAGPLAERARAAVALADLDSAATAYAELARTAPTIDAGCRARTGLVAAYASAPWVVDARTLAAIAELARFAAAHDRTALAGCLADAAPVLERVGRWPSARSRRDGGLTESVARSLALVARFPEVERALLPVIAEGELALGRADDARASYLRLLELGGDHPAIEAAARGYHDSATAAAQGPPIDPCEASELD